MSDKRLSEAEARKLAEAWFRQRSRPLEALDRNLKMVPFRELPEAGPGALVAGAIHEQLRTEGYREEVQPMPSFIATARCMNCGESRPAWAVEDGWCDSCADAADKALDSKEKAEQGVKPVLVNEGE